jgi:hypothetical protein
MSTLLQTLRQHALPLTPEEFLNYHPGCWVQYYDDTAAKNPALGLSVPAFDREVARTKQGERCAVCFSLQAFEGARKADRLVCVQNLGVDVDLGRGGYGEPLPPEQLDTAKDDYLRQCLLNFRLRPHWLTETGHGFHAVFRLKPIRDPQLIRTALTVNRRLVTALRGDENAILPTQVLRVPNTYQFKDPARPFLCRLLLDNARSLPSYELSAVEDALSQWDVGPRHGPQSQRPDPRRSARARRPESNWQAGLAGVPEGVRNAVAASIIGSILVRLPQDLWEVAGWGGLKEWNCRNGVPLPEPELRAVFDSIARRERRKRRPGRATGGTPSATSPTDRAES